MASTLQVITVAAALVTIITGIIGITQHMGDISNKPPLIDNLTPDSSSPLDAGNTIIWTAKATDLDGDAIQYKFFLNGNPVTDWSPQSFWVWSNTKANSGENHIEVCIRDGKHANSDSYDDFRVANFTIIEKNQYQTPTISTPPVGTPNQPPSINELTSAPNSPQPAGITIVWATHATDPDVDQIFYRYFLNDKSETDWSNDNTWFWKTSKENIGKNQIEVQVKDGKHATQETFDDHTYTSFTIEDFEKTSKGQSNSTDSQSVERSPNQSDEPVGEVSKSSIIDSNPVTVSNSSTRIGFTRTNEYANNDVEPNCEPESKQATCSSPDSCVDCSGKCWPPGSYDLGKTICSHGKWTIHWTEHAYR